ncbi:valine--tRNA ligase [Candidatus Campbellbacteria bacterium CG22_combo_CG10-13_8_21_14_all_36_13]|uniref:Valine--tRNA ligase n=1 Tax=Candidatus Campbellbacteria bacterium CG22_combo_CG10-13_8_21_14_all_36_13 TaxID=1974529 RepID=A0A2H0DYK8_9BACT|nr:MAG: valine--tRNA ligase [Candidatus Campbellbacteria bacterium CG22_combo_CG10-13_8_21_14_all_36_13]
MQNIPEKFLKPYEPTKTERSIYKYWEKSDFFNPDTCIEKGICEKGAETFSIVLPPPNVTGVLHTGHAGMLAIEDIIVRFNRMRGKNTLWVPGTDHAGIATQTKVEKEIYKKEGKNRHDLGREDFLKRVEDFAQDSHDTIVEQMKQMGASVDWSREAFTLDEKRELAVRTAFTKMYEAGLIYKGFRSVNWDPKMQTVVSDEEVDYEEQKSKFYYLKYGPFTIGTARPETKFGDKYVVIHPDDKRYAEYKHGDKLTVEWINGPIEATIIKDEVIDMEFGTGVMTITPWHSEVDFELAEKHGLDKEQIIDLYGKLLPIAGEFAGMKIKDARDKIIEKLEQKGLVEKIDDRYENKIATNSRGSGVIEPQILEQWFVNVNKEFTIPYSNINEIKSGSVTTLKKIMKTSVASGQIKILPDRFEKTYFNWIDNLRDWNISRQLWYGHRIPVWYRDKETYVGVSVPEGDGWTQDPDTLDTWFSSGLWTFSTLGWPENTEDLKTYHPTTLLETGYDIIFFWVARMVLMSGFLLGEVPFNTVYLHGLVRDEKGAKISKSLGNNIDPLELIEKYGADALRMALIVGVGPGSDLSLSENKIKAYKHFSNKIWNATRFVLANMRNDFDYIQKPPLVQIDEQYIKELNNIIEDITSDMNQYRLYLAGEKLYHYFWHTYADIIIEGAKERLKNGNDTEKKSAEWTLVHILISSLKLLHPFMPFITEAIWKDFPIKEKKILMVEKWPGSE